MLGLVLLAGPRGCSSTTAAVGVNGTGTTGLEVSVDPPLLARSDILGPYYSHRLDKTDWLFGASYALEGKVDLTLLPRGAAKSYIYTAKMPGSLLSSNASTTQDDVATWAVNPGYKYALRAQSREIRWWLVVATLVLAVAAAYLLLVSKRSA